MLSQDKLKKLAIVSGGTAVALLPVAARADESISGAVDAVQPSNAASGSLQENVKNIINVMLIVIGIVAPK